MNLEHEEFTLAHEIIENSIKMSEYNFDAYVTKSFFDMSVMSNRGKVYDFLSLLSSLYFNIMLNGHLYLYGEKEEKLAKQGRLIIVDVIKKLREND
jgi:hypothetical protein